MGTRAKIEQEIAAVAAEVRELVRQRGGALPGVAEWVDLMLALVGDDGAGAMADAFDLAGPPVMAAHVQEVRMVPAAEPLAPPC